MHRKGQVDQTKLVDKQVVSEEILKERIEGIEGKEEQNDSIIGFNEHFICVSFVSKMAIQES